MFEVIAAKLIPIKSKASFQRIMEASVVKEVFYNQMSFKTILYVETGILLFALLVGAVAEFRLHGKQLMMDRVMWMLRKTGIMKTSDKVEKTGHGEGEGLSQRDHAGHRELVQKDTTGNCSVVIEVESFDCAERDDIEALISEYEDFHVSWVNRMREYKLVGIHSSTR